MFTYLKVLFLNETKFMCNIIELLYQIMMSSLYKIGYVLIFTFKTCLLKSIFYQHFFGSLHCVTYFYNLWIYCDPVQLKILLKFGSELSIHIESHCSKIFLFTLIYYLNLSYHQALLLSIHKVEAHKIQDGI